MDLKQTTDVLIHIARHYKRTYGYELTTDNLKIMIEWAWTAGRNEGYEQGANKVLSRVDERMGEVVG
jgi:hypothetical protein